MSIKARLVHGKLYNRPFAFSTGYLFSGIQASFHDTSPCDSSPGDRRGRQMLPPRQKASKRPRLGETIPGLGFIYFFYSLLFSVLFTRRIMNKDSMRVGSAEDSFLRLENSDLIKTLLTVSADSCNCIGLLSFLRMLNCSLNTCDSKRNKNKLNKFTYF